MQKRTYSVMTITAAAVCLTLGGCTAKTPVKMMLPAETDLSSFRRVSIVGFQGQGGEQLANALESTLNDTRVNGERYFEVISRRELGASWREQDLNNASDRFDEKTRARLGKLKGVDALIVGTVNEYGAADRTYSETREVYRKKQSYNVTYNCIERAARIHLNVKFIDVNTADVPLSVPLEGKAEDQDCQPSGTALNVQDRNDMLRKAVDDMFRKFAAQIAPHEVTKNVELREKDDGIGFFGGGSEAAKAATEQIKSGVSYAKGGAWPLAIGAWERAVQANPSSAAAYYNLGVAYEAQGKLEKSQDMYQKAAQLKAEPLYVAATGTIAQRISDQARVEAQTKGRR